MLCSFSAIHPFTFVLVFLLKQTMKLFENTFFSPSTFTFFLCFFYFIRWLSESLLATRWNWSPHRLSSDTHLSFAWCVISKSALFQRAAALRSHLGRDTEPSARATPHDGEPLADVPSCSSPPAAVSSPSPIHLFHPFCTPHLNFSLGLCLQPSGLSPLHHSSHYLSVSFSMTRNDQPSVPDTLISSSLFLALLSFTHTPVLCHLLCTPLTSSFLISSLSLMQPAHHCVG